ncbi:uncharacterized protein TNCV_4051591 [Trichonephila clavipes]|nr:uncharacterized protein TNCV_4051591 [Trichonephila clavipes]
MHILAFSLPGCPSYLNETIKERSVTIQRKEKMKQLDEQLFTNFIKKDAITSFECLKENLLMRENPISDFLSKNNVLKHNCESCITFLFMNCENCPSILKSLKINTDLSIVIFNNNRELNIPSVGKILNNPPRLTYFSELLNILNTVNVSEEICSINSVPHRVMAIQSWEKIVRVQYFVRGGFVGHRSRASSKHLFSHLPVDGARFLGGQTGVALQLQDARVGVGSTKMPTRCLCSVRLID